MSMYSILGHSYVNAHRRASLEARYCILTVTCVHVVEPLVVAASRNHPLLDGVAALVN